jgi:hypothetical protein
MGLFGRDLRLGEAVLDADEGVVRVTLRAVAT